MLKRLTVIALAIITGISFTACGARSRDVSAFGGKNTAYETAAVTSAEGAVSTEAVTEMELVEEADGAMLGTNEAALPTDGRKIIRNAYVTIETKEFDTAAEEIRRTVQENNGYIEFSALHSGGGSRSAEYTCRIPAESYNDFCGAAQSVGSVVYSEESTEDTTAEYIDVESRLKSLRAQEETLLALLEKSGTLEDMITVQDKLSEVQYRIESYTAQLNALSNLVDYSTVSITLNEVKTYTPVEPSFGERIANAFADMLAGLKNAMESLVIGAVYMLPLWIVVGVVLVVVLIAAKRRRRKRLNAAQSINTTVADNNSEER